MSTEIKVPTLPESVADATVVTWHKQPGEAVGRDEVLVDIETDKVVLEVPSPVEGIVEAITEGEGALVVAHQVLGTVSEGGQAAAAPAQAQTQTDASSGNEDKGDAQSGPGARLLMEQQGLTPADIKGSGKNGRIMKEDVEAEVAKRNAAPTATATAKSSAPTPSAPPSVPSAGAVNLANEERTERRVPMTRLRARIAERLLYAKQNTAMLTTFNEVDMQPLMDLRTKYKADFEKAHGVKLGFMSPFIKAAAEALKRFPDVNASIDGNDIVYHGFCDIGVAVSSERGLVVPVIRNAEHLSLAGIESTLGDYAKRARDGKLGIEEMTGGTFTISNGGTFGSLLSTPILNPPQSAILGMHATQPRPVVVNGEIVIRPMMYIALSYDHRIIDGQGAVTFLKTIKELVEEPAKILLDI